jgi:hypothetical protein
VTIESCEAFALCDEDMSVNKYIVEFAQNQPLIVFEDVGTGNELVFALQNKIDYLRDERRFIDYGRSVNYSREFGIVKRKVNFAALSVYGSVILPVHKGCTCDGAGFDEGSCKPSVIRFGENDDGDLTLLQTYSEELLKDISDRLSEEDLLSVIEGFFLPMEENETDYSILGEIEAVECIENELTEEEVLRLSLKITGTQLQLLINKRDLVGYPSPGMRFMGTCRLRGSVII